MKDSNIELVDVLWFSYMCVHHLSLPLALQYLPIIDWTLLESVCVCSLEPPIIFWGIFIPISKRKYPSSLATSSKVLLDSIGVVRSVATNPIKGVKNDAPANGAFGISPSNVDSAPIIFMPAVLETVKG